MTTIKKKIFNLHILPFLIFLIYYLYSLIIFEAVVVSPHDNIEFEAVYDRIISRILKGDFNSYRIFLSGEFKWYYLDRIFYPVNLFHVILSDKQFYFFKEVIEKLVSYFSFYLLAKFLCKEKTYSIFGALFYTTLINDISSPPPTIFLPVMPYLFYLLISKTQLRIKHLATIFFIGLNSSLVFDYISMVMMLIISYFISSQKSYKTIFIFFTTISLGMTIVGIPLFLSVLGEPLHRLAMIKEGFLDIATLELKKFYEMLLPNFTEISDSLARLLRVLILISCFYIKNKKANLILLFIVTTYVLKTLMSSDLSQIIFNNFFVFAKGLNFSRVGNILPLLFSVLLVTILKANQNKVFKKILIVLTISTSISFQLYYPTYEFTKELLRNNLKEESFELIKINFNQKNNKKIILIMKDKKNYKFENFIYKVKTGNSFDSYFRIETYKKIKKLIGNSRVASVGVNPMIAPMNDINVIDGYHQMYPLSYKKKFRKIIEEELNQSKVLKDYYDNWGNRVYMLYNNQDNLLLNFNEAKKLGAEYIISSFPLQNKNIEPNYLLYNEDNKTYLYKII